MGGIENSAAVNGIEGKAMSIEFDSPREERIKALIDEDAPGTGCMPAFDSIFRERIEKLVRRAVALGEALKEEELTCSGCHRKLDLPWYCKDCENKENKVGGGRGSILPLDRIERSFLK